MTAHDFGRYADRLVRTSKWTQADRDEVVVALRQAEKLLLDQAAQIQRLENEADDEHFK